MGSGRACGGWNENADGLGYNGTERLDTKLKNPTYAYLRIRECVTEDGLRFGGSSRQPAGRVVGMRSEPPRRGLHSGIKRVGCKAVKEEGEILGEGLLHGEP